ncbi:MAG: enoyl-CoA hydratase/isomerase family protein [Pigmentiphaga sp.]
MHVETRIGDGVATVVLNRPDRKNAVTVDMRSDIREAFERLAYNDDARVVVLTGAGDAFCAGADVGGMGGRGLVASRARVRTLQQTVLAIHSLEKPVVAAVRGAAVGFGWSLALACDLILASSTARFSQVFQRVGLAPDGGSAYFLTRNLGVLRAKELIFSTRMVSADEALALGLVNQVFADDVFDDAVRESAQRLGAGPSFAMGLAKKMVHATAGQSLETFFETELLIQSQLTQTADYREGTAAFREKRVPHFIGE